METELTEYKNTFINFYNSHHKPQKKRSQYIYVVYNRLNGLFKIGRSTNPNRRIKGIESMTGQILDLIMLMELNENYEYSISEAEKNIHEYFKEQRKVGEWFELDDLDLEDLNFHCSFYETYSYERFALIR